LADNAGPLLVRSGLIAQEQLLEARQAVAGQGGTLGEHLVLAGHVDDDELTGFFHTRLMVPLVDPNLLARIPARMIRKIPVDMAAEFRLVPVSLDREQNLTVVMSDPSNTHAVDEITFFTGFYVMRAVATQRQIAWCLAHYYGQVTPLGETLLQPRGDGAAVDAIPTERVKPSITDRVDASRHRVEPPVSKATEPSPPEPTEPPTPPPPAQPEAPISDPPSDFDGEVTAPTGPIMTTQPVMSRPDPDFGEEVTRPTGPIKIIEADEPEDNDDLQPRAGEVMVRSETDATPLIGREDGALPAVVITEDDEDDEDGDEYEDDEDGDEYEDDEDDDDDDGPTTVMDRATDDAPAPVPVAEEDDNSAIVVMPVTDQSGTAPILLERLARSSSQPPPNSAADEAISANDEVLVLTQPKRRRRQPTDIGMAVGSAETTPPELDDNATNPANSAAPRAAHEGDETERVSTGKFRRLQYGDFEDDGFGPPGTTIPPAFLGAMPDAEIDDTSAHAIPIVIDPSGISGSVALPAKNAAKPQSVAGLAATMEDAAEAQRELEQSSQSLLETLRLLDRATTRDVVIDILLDHLHASFACVSFFVVKSGVLCSFLSKGTGAAKMNERKAELTLSKESTFRDVIRTRLPFSGPIPDEATRAFIAAIQDDVSDNVLVVPCTVRERAVGLLYGSHQRNKRIFQEHVAVVTRAAGMALERILKSQKGR
jgi:hypothetical protein